MAESPSESTSNSPPTSTVTTTKSAQTAQTAITAISTSRPPHAVPEIPIEFVSEEEMALLEAALAATRSLMPSAIRSPPPSPFRGGSPRSLRSITVLSKRRFSGGSDVEDSYLLRFRRNQALSVTDVTGTEWCEKQMENVLRLGRRKVSRAMKVGQARHLELEEEVVKRIKVRIESDEDKWALKLASSITGVNQFLFEGLTRELPLLGFVEGEWIMGVIDEVRMPSAESSDSHPILIDTKTRLRDTLPAEPQRRNGKLQLMLYKLLWDTLVTTGFPSRAFFSYLSLNRHVILSQDVRDSTAKAGFPAQTLEDIVRYYENAFKMLPTTQNQLLLRYEFQKDQSLLAELRFDNDSGWCKSKFREILEFWRGEREARFTPEEERWKCRYCQFASVCPGNPDFDSATPSSPPLEASSAS